VLVALAAGKGGAADEEIGDDELKFEMIDALIAKSRNASEIGITTCDWHTEVYDEAPEGYKMLLDKGIDMVDVEVGSTAVTLLADVLTNDQPRYCMRLTPRPTYGFGMMLSKKLVYNWTVIHPLETTMKKLGVETAEMLMLHTEGGARMNFAFWVYDAVAEAYRNGLCNKVGLSHANADISTVKRVQDELQRRGVPLSSVRLPLSLLDRSALELVQECKRLGIQVFATTPLGRDELASGRYTASNPTGGEIAVPRFTLAQLIPLRPLHEALANVAARVRSRTEKLVGTTTITLQWVRTKGASPFCDVESEANAKAILMCQDWKLEPDEVAMLDKAADEVDKNRPAGYRG